MFWNRYRMDSEAKRIPPFDPYADADKLARNWLVWKRNLFVYLESKEDLKTPKAKLAKFLFFAGENVQTIYFQHMNKLKKEHESTELKKAEEEKADKDKTEGTDSDGEETEQNDKEVKDVDVFEDVLLMFDGLFMNQSNQLQQRTIFRSLTQTSQESTAAFVVRLREQIRFCGFADGDIDQMIIEQIAEKGKSVQLCREILKRPRTLEEVLRIAKSIENTSNFEEQRSLGRKAGQSEASSSSEVHWVSQKRERKADQQTESEFWLSA